jgi:serine/threonine-protein kinase
MSAPSQPGLTLTATDGPYKGQTFAFTGHEVFLVGRSKEAHLQIAQDGHVSRHHFLVEINVPDCRLTDLGSKHGTFVNGRRVQSADLHAGDVIRAGHTTLVVAIPGAGAAPPAVDPDAATLPPPSAAPGGVSATAATAETLPPTMPVSAALPPTAPPSATEPGAAPSDLPETVHSDGLAAPLAPPTFVVPQVPGYQIERELGRGGMGVVYLAVREDGGARVALKTIVPAVAVNRNQVQRFLREADILRQLQHANIVAFRDVGESGGALYFAMDYVEGTDAAKLLKQHGPLPVRTAVRMLCQLLSALEYAHGRGFVHRDIKPANLLVAEEGGKKTVKLADFGLARAYQESRMSGLTIQGDVGGTVAFMPPEQITNFRQVKPAADQYSAAATLYTLLTGRLLFDFEAGQAHGLSRVLQEEPVPARRRRADLPDELAAAVHRALAKDAAARFPNVHAFRAALTPFAV